MSRYVNIDGDWVNYALKAYGPGRYEDDEYAIPIERLYSAPSIEIVRCGECKYAEVSVSPITELWCTRFGINDMAMKADDFCSCGCNCSGKPNNCEHITEDGVTCAKYPACDDCPDNPLNKVKGSERLVKGTEKPNNSND